MRAATLTVPVLAPLAIVMMLLLDSVTSTGACAETSGAGWKWCGLLAAFSVLYLAIGIFAFEPLLEES